MYFPTPSAETVRKVFGSLLVVGILFFASSFLSARAINAPAQNAGIGGGAIFVGGVRDIAIGTTTVQTGTKFTLVPDPFSFASLSNYALQVLQPNLTPLFIAGADADQRFVYAASSSPGASGNTLRAMAIDSQYMYSFSVAESLPTYWKLQKRNISDGSLVWATTTGTFSTGAPPANGITVDSQYIYLVGGDGYGEWRIQKRNLSDGAPVAAFGTGGTVTSTPGSDQWSAAHDIALDGTYMYISGLGGNLANPTWRIEKRAISDGAFVGSFGTGGVVDVGSNSSVYSVMGIALDPVSGYLYASGFLTGGVTFQRRTLSSGALQYSTPAANLSNMQDLYLDTSTDSLYIVGGSSGSGENWVVDKYIASTGNLVWTISDKISGSGSRDTSYSVVLVQGYPYVVGGVGSPSAFQCDLWRIEKRSPTDGALIENITYDPSNAPGEWSDCAFSVVTDGNFIYVGGTYGAGTGVQIGKLTLGYTPFSGNAVAIGGLFTGAPSVLYVAGTVNVSGTLAVATYGAGTAPNPVSSSMVLPGVFATSSGNFAFRSSLGIGTTTQTSLPQALSVYGGMYVSSSVGIGTPSPQSALHVANGSYAQIENQNPGAPASGGCSSMSQRGRWALDTANDRLYICSGTSTARWSYMAIIDPTGADTTPPTASMTAPANGATVSSTITVSANAADNVAVVGVQFKLDGGDLNAEDTSSPYSISWVTTSTTDGVHMLSATARDAAGNTTTTSNVTVTVSNGAAALAYALDEGSGTTAADSSGNGLTGTVTATWTTGKYSGGLSMNGTSNQVSRANFTLGSQFTMMAWVNEPDFTNHETILSVGATREFYFDEFGTLNFWDNANWVGGPAVAAGGWHHVAVTSDGATVKFYVDGVQQGGDQSLSMPSGVTDTFQAGAVLSSYDFFSGSIDEPQVFNQVLTQTEIQTAMNTALAGGADTTPPIASMTAPANGATVSSTVMVSANASDNVAIISVQFKLDGGNLSAADTSSPYSISWGTTSTSNGAHTLSAVARDAAENTTTTPSVSVTVSNGGGDTTKPTASMTAPANGAVVSSTVTVSANASDNVAVVGVQFKLDGGNLNAEDTTSPYSISWITTSTANGSHNLTATARDAAGNTTTTSNVTVTVSNDITPPTVSLTAPAAGATVSSTVMVSSTASDNIAVLGVQFKLDGGNLGAEDTTSPYGISWVTTSTTNGSHNLSATARDAAGNTSTTPNRSVTVSNDITPPTVSLTAPAAGATVSSTVTVSSTASDNVAVVGVQFKLDGANLGAEDTTSPYGILWGSTSTSNGSHNLTATARDAMGNTSTTPNRAVSVWNATSAFAYALNTGAGTVATDSSGNNATGTIAGGSWVAGKYGNGVTLNGTTGQITRKNFTLGAQFTMMAWVKEPAFTNHEAIISVGATREFYFDNVGTLNFWDTTKWVGSAGIATGAWHHVAISSDGANVTFYVDGVAQGGAQVYALGSPVTATSSVGSVWTYDFLSGTVDEPRIYNRALSQVEIQLAMNTPL